MTKRRIYIAGPMRMKRNLNREAFESMERTLTMLGFDVVNPHTLGFDEGHDIREIMQGCLLALLECDGIFMLPGWVSSSGARVEHELARCTNIKIIDAEIAKVINVASWFPPSPDDKASSHLRMVGGDRDDDG